MNFKCLVKEKKPRFAESHEYRNEESRNTDTVKDIKNISAYKRIPKTS